MESCNASNIRQKFSTRRCCLAGMAALILLPAMTLSGATPLGRQQTQERLDRRQGDRQMQARLSMPRLHETVQSDLMQPQVRPAPRLRAREWNADLAPRPLQFDDQREKQRRVRATLN